MLDTLLVRASLAPVRTVTYYALADRGIHLAGQVLDLDAGAGVVERVPVDRQVDRADA
jgi:hypothetical protein